MKVTKFSKQTQVDETSKCFQSFVHVGLWRAYKNIFNSFQNMFSAITCQVMVNPDWQAVGIQATPKVGHLLPNPPNNDLQLFVPTDASSFIHLSYFSLPGSPWHRSAGHLADEGNIFNTYSIQPVPYYFEAIKMTSQA